MDGSGYQGGDTVGGKLGCLASALIGLPLWGALWFLSFFGTCRQVDPCHRGEGVKALALLGIVAVVAAVVGLTIRYLVNRRGKE
jgi:hypothetical protein